MIKVFERQNLNPVGDFQEKQTKYTILYTAEGEERGVVLGIFNSEEATLDAYNKLLEGFKKIRNATVETVDETTCNVTGTGYKIDRRVCDDNGRYKKTSISFKGVISCRGDVFIANRLNSRNVLNSFGLTLPRQ